MADTIIEIVGNKIDIILTRGNSGFSLAPGGEVKEIFSATFEPPDNMPTSTTFQPPDWAWEFIIENTKTKERTIEKNTANGSILYDSSSGILMMAFTKNDVLMHDSKYKYSYVLRATDGTSVRDIIYGNVTVGSNLPGEK